MALCLLPSLRAQEHELQAYFDARARGDVTNTWSDFNLLVFAAKSRAIGAPLSLGLPPQALMSFFVCFA